MSNQPKNNKRGPVDGVEIYARKIINSGVITSDTYAKVVTADYGGNGSVVVESTPETKHSGIKGIFFEVGGNMQQDGVIKTSKDAVVAINVRGDYKSEKGKVIQGEFTQNAWHTTWWGFSVLTVGAGIIVGGFIYIFGWEK